MERQPSYPDLVLDGEEAWVALNLHHDGFSSRRKIDPPCLHVATTRGYFLSFGVILLCVHASLFILDFLCIFRSNVS